MCQKKQVFLWLHVFLQTNCQSNCPAKSSFLELSRIRRSMLRYLKNVWWLRGWLVSEGVLQFLTFLQDVFLKKSCFCCFLGCEFDAVDCTKLVKLMYFEQNRFKECHLISDIRHITWTSALRSREFDIFRPSLSIQDAAGCAFVNLATLKVSKSATWYPSPRAPLGTKHNSSFDFWCQSGS